MNNDELKLAAEYQRGYEDGKKAKGADEWRLDYERSKVVSRLKESKPLLGMSKVEILCDLGKAITDAPDFDTSEIGHIDLMWNTLIHLLGGENGTCPNDDGTCPNYVPTASNVTEQSITSELRKWGYGFCGDTYDVVTAIADRIDEQFDRICEQQERVLQSTIDHMTDAHMDEVQSVHDELANELAKTKELLEISYAKRRALKLHIDQMKGGSKRWRKLYEDAQKECADLLDLLRDAAEDYRKLKAKYDMHEGVLDATLASLKNSVELPKDRDGVTWNFGDRFAHKGKTYEVSSMRLYETGKWGLETSTRDGNFNPIAFTHFHAHTAESIVRDLTLGRITEQEAVELIEELRNE